MTHVALLGLGIMGGGMAGSLLRKGFTLTVYNRTRAKAEPLAAQGARVADSPRQAADGADVIIAMVGDDNASRAVWLGNEGALDAAKPGTVLVECSTLSPDWVREWAALAAAHGCACLDAPVGGSKEAAANGQLRLFVGGEAAVVEGVRPVLEAFSAEISLLGENGAGATWKLINNMMIAAQMTALAEAVALAEASGLNMEQVNQLILNGAGASGIVRGKLPRMMQRRYDDTEFSLRWMHKDVEYALGLAETFGVRLFSVGAAQAVFARGLSRNLGDLDFAAVVEAVRKD
jgi:3-hydroxyisobutyrate dehydrogenase